MMVKVNFFSLTNIPFIHPLDSYLFFTNNKIRQAASDTRAGLLGAWSVPCCLNENAGGKPSNYKSEVLVESSNYSFVGV